jgi:hypothetical protein
MSWMNWLVWGFVATAVLTTLMAGSEGLGITRMNIPHMLGTMFTPNRDRAKVHGVVLHFLNGWAFSIVYIIAFHTAHIFTWWFGALLGFLHGAFVAAVALPVMPGVHPRMASELRGPTVARQLEPPGFLGLNYGVRTPISVLIAHVAFGALLGALYSPAGTGAPRAAAAPQASIRSPDGEQDDRQRQQDQGRHHRDRQVSPGARQPLAGLGGGRPRPPGEDCPPESATIAVFSRSLRNCRARSSSPIGTSTAIGARSVVKPINVLAAPRKRAAIPSFRRSSASISPWAGSGV